MRVYSFVQNSVKEQDTLGPLKYKDIYIIKSVINKLVCTMNTESYKKITNSVTITASITLCTSVVVIDALKLAKLHIITADFSCEVCSSYMTAFIRMQSKKQWATFYKVSKSIL